MVKVFAPFAAAHLLSYVLRSINAVLGSALATALSFDARQIGVITSAYFVGFAIAQLPVGLALDRFGPKRTQCSLLALGAFGCVLFASTDSFGCLVLARTLIGIGLAACFMGAVKAISDWLPATRMPSVNGYLLAVGGFGAMIATWPVQIVVETVGWRLLFVLLGGLILLTAVATHCLYPESALVDRRVETPIRSLWAVYRDQSFRRIISVMLVPHAVFFGIQGLWMGGWLRDAVGLTPRIAAGYLFAGAAAVVASTLVVGRMTEQAVKRGHSAMDIAASGLFAFMLIQVLIVADVRWAAGALAIGFPLFGAFAGLQFTIVAQSVPASMTGRASTCLNLLIFIGSFAVQAGFGAILRMWTDSSGGAQPVDAYRVAFGVLVLLQIPGLAIWLIRRLARALGKFPARLEPASN